jgi:acetylornithine deacetylase/succinyl-diaminopimelate desuccinylase-like protein
LVCGPGSIDQAHRKDEWVSIDHLNKAVAIYERAFRDWATV